MAIKRFVSRTIELVGERLKPKAAPAIDYQAMMAEQAKNLNLVDLDKAFFPIAEQVRPFTMTSFERMFALYKSVEYIVKAGIPGDMLECGVWRGGSMMLVAKTLLSLGDTSRTLHLFDTFEGHPRPDPSEDIDLHGNRVVDEWQAYRKSDESSEWAYASLKEVRANMKSTGYPFDKIVFVKGMVEKTAAANAPAQLAMARLDTDWYWSARIGLETFWPRLSRKGVLIVDDYGHYPSQRKAVDEFFANNPVLLHRIDYSCRTVVKVD